MKLSLKQTILIILLIITPVLLSMLPFFIQSYMSPVDRVFTGLHRWSEDYYGYLHTINQGLMGHLQVVSKLTLQPHQPTFVHSEYAILGLVGRFLNLNAPLAYHLSRLFLGAVFVIIAFYFLYFLFQKAKSKSPIAKSIIAFFLAFFVGGFPHIISLWPLQIEPYLSWWTELDVLTRSTILPHYLMGNILFLLIIILYLKINNDSQPLKAKSQLLILGIFSFLLAFVHPIDFLILGCSLGMFVLFQIILNFVARKQYSINHILSSILSTIRQLADQILLLLLIFVSGLIPALYYRYALSLPFWRFILAHGTTTSYNIPLFDLTMALGPVFIIGVIGIFIFLAARLTNFLRSRYVHGTERTLTPEKNFVSRASQEIEVKLLLFCWFIVQSLFFLKFYQVFNFDRLRTMEAPFYIPLAFFTTILMFKFTEWLTNFLRSRYVHGTERTLTPEKNFVRHSLITVFVVLIFLITLPTTIMGLKNQIFVNSDFKTFSLFSYPTVKQYESWQFLKKNTPDNSLITSLYEEKFLIPTVSGNKIAFGANFDNDKNYQNNVNKINQMYSGLLSPEDTQNFLHTNHIQYVYWGYQEQSLGGDLTKYPFLQKIFGNGEVIIFKVK